MCRRSDTSYGWRRLRCGRAHKRLEHDGLQNGFVTTNITAATIVPKPTGPASHSTVGSRTRLANGKLRYVIVTSHPPQFVITGSAHRSHPICGS